jgi:hypothetical protein
MKQPQASSRHSATLITLSALFILVLGMFSWNIYAQHKKDAVVGAWFVTAPDAPFSYHMFTFYADGTMGQANPDAGDQNTSDSDGAGIWKRKGDTIQGKFVEATADRKTGAFATRGEISFQFMVHGDQFKGTADANFFDLQGKHLRGPLPTPLTGQRVKL